jgi:predicted outer membrane repeat protein
MAESQDVMRQEPRRRLARGAGVTVGATLLMGGTAQGATTFTVDSLADPSDPGHTTLHDALASAEMPSNAGSTITFASGLSGSINLTTDLHSIDYATKIAGPGASQLAVSGQNARGIFHAVGLAGNGLQISGLTLRNGNNIADTRGGAIFLAGGSPASVSDTVLTGNTAQDGGAIYSLNGSLDIQRSTITSNTASNTAMGSSAGGGIHSEGTALTISDSLISGNSGVQGAAIKIVGSGAFGSLLLQRSTLSGNTATGGCCGGIYSYTDQTTRILDSTISGNHAVSAPSGGMYNVGPLSVVGSTFSGNSTTGAGGGIFASASNEPTLQDTIVAGNSAFTGPDLFGAASAAFTLIGDPSGATVDNAIPGSNLTGVDPQLQPVAANGGPTPTMALAATSPALDKGSAFGLSTDQRGSPRPFDLPSVPSSSAPGADGSDIGAFEFQQAPATPATPAAPVKKCKKKHKKKHKHTAQSAKKKKKGCKKKKKKQK